MKTIEKRPTREQVAAAAGKRIPDVIAPGLSVLFCGINPSLYSGATGHHFARPGNRFWRALHQSGFTERLLSPFEDASLVGLGLGITNLVARATGSAAELSPGETRRGGARLAEKVRRYSPRIVAILGIDAYRVAFAVPDAAIGPQPATLGGARLWVLPNPSGLNAHWQLPALAEVFRQMREDV